MITGKFPNLRLRRLRKFDWSRRLVRENTLSTNDLIYPLFIIEGKNKKIPIKSMPNFYKYSIDTQFYKFEKFENIHVGIRTRYIC